MRITAKARYGLRILMDIAVNERPERPRTIKEISEAQGIGEKFISRLVVSLRENGMIHSERGRDGGFRLAKAPSDITLLDVIEALQGPISVVDCVGCPRNCDKTKKCVASSIWVDVNSAIRSSLAGITMEKIMARISGTGFIPSSIAEYAI